MKRHLPILLMVAVLVSIAAVASAEELPEGKLIPRVTCVDSPDLSYALYLPSSYDPEKKWPVIFGFSPGARGRTPVELLQAAAEKYGYIVVGSNDSKNGPMEPIIRAREAVWKDVNARFSVDEKRSYATGFSGGARVALDMAITHHDRFAGVISCGAFYPGNRPLPEKTHLVFFGLVGDTCFNNPELNRADRDLGERGFLHWIEEFPGGHTWPPATLMTEAVEFLQIAAMRAGQVPEDPEFAAGLVKPRVASADKLAESGKKMLALRKYRQTAELFAGIEGAEAAAARAKAIEEDPEVKAYGEGMAELAKLTSALRNPGDQEAFAAAIRRLKEIAEEGGPLADRAKTILQMVAMSLGQGATAALMAKELDKAIRYLTLAHELLPRDATTAYNLACAYSLSGEKAKAVEWLGKAVDLGFTSLAHIDDDDDLDNIRGEPGYQEIIRKLGAK